MATLVFCSPSGWSPPGCSPRWRPRSDGSGMVLNYKEWSRPSRPQSRAGTATRQTPRSDNSRGFGGSGAAGLAGPARAKSGPARERGCLAGDPDDRPAVLHPACLE